MTDLADDSQMGRRQALAEEFYDALRLEQGEGRPVFVSDEATLYDVQIEPEDVVVRRVQEEYGFTLRIPADFRRPFWQLLDELQRRRQFWGNGTNPPQ